MFHSLAASFFSMARITTFALAAMAGLSLLVLPAAALNPDAGTDEHSPAIVELEARPALVLAGTADWDKGSRAIARSINQLRRQMNTAGLEPAGTPLAAITETNFESFSYEVMIPIASRPEPLPNFSNRVKVGSSPAGRAMKFVHRGSYDDIEATYEEINDYLGERGIQAKPVFVEEYVNLPRNPDSDGAEVGIYIFLK